MTHPVLADLRAEDPAIRRAACAAAAEDPSAVLLVDALCETLGDPDASVARAASRALVSLRAHQETVRTALSAALRSQDPSCRMRAALTQAQVEPPPIKLLPALVEALGHAEAEERWQVIRALVELGRLHDEVFPVLVSLVDTEDSPRTRRMAVLALRALAPDRVESARVILAASRSSDIALRRVALSACASLGAAPEATLDRLAEALRDDPDPASRRCAAAALRSMARRPELPDHIVDALQGATEDDDASVRSHAVQALAGVSDAPG